MLQQRGVCASLERLRQRRQQQARHLVSPVPGMGRRFQRRGVDTTKSSLLVPAPKYQLLEIDPDDRTDWREVKDEDRGKQVMTLVQDATGYPDNVVIPMFKRRMVQIHANNGRVFAVSPHYNVREGDVLGLPKMLPAHLWNKLQGDEPPVRKLSLDEIKMVRSWVVFKNDDCIVINKPPAVPCEPSKGSTLSLHELLPGLRYSCEERPRLVSTLEKDASGCVVLGRTQEAVAYLNRYLRVPRMPSFCYWAAVAKKPKIPQGRVEMHLDMDKGAAGDRVVVRMEKTRTSVYSRVEYSVVSESRSGPAWVSIYPLTLRRNEARIASSMVLKAPILGDTKYGGDAALPYRELSTMISRMSNELPLFLHCHQVSLPYEDMKKNRVVVRAPLPEHMKSLWKLMLWDHKYVDPYLTW